MTATTTNGKTTNGASVSNMQRLEAMDDTPQATTPTARTRYAELMAEAKALGHAANVEALLEDLDAIQLVAGQLFNAAEAGDWATFDSLYNGSKNGAFYGPIDRIRGHVGKIRRG